MINLIDNEQEFPVEIQSTSGQSVKLIGITKAINTEEHPVPEDIVSYCARVSNPSNQSNYGTAKGLLRYLVKHKHWSPLEMVSATVEITTTRDIARQILRHRSFAFQEFSQRYADPTELPMMYREARLQDLVNRQNSIDTDDTALKLEFLRDQQEHWNDAVRRYKKALDAGIAKEQARCFLPEGNTQSVMYMQGSLRSWLHYVDLRSGNGTQKEHIWLAESIGEILASEFPTIMGLTQESKGDTL